MMVVDASVWVSMLLETDLFHTLSHSWFEEYSRFNGEIAAPSLLLPEVAGGLTRRTNDALVGRQAIQYLAELSGLYIIPIDQRLAATAAELAADYRLRGADAVYVALAYSLDVPLLTWDQEQMMRVNQVVKAGPPGTVFGSNGQNVALE
jgi:predicted nucleic acid-binding protein